MLQAFELEIQNGLESRKQAMLDKVHILKKEARNINVSAQAPADGSEDEVIGFCEQLDHLLQISKESLEGCSNLAQISTANLNRIDETFKPEIMENEPMSSHLDHMLEQLRSTILVQPALGQSAAKQSDGSGSAASNPSSSHASRKGSAGSYDVASEVRCDEPRRSYGYTELLKMQQKEGVIEGILSHSENPNHFYIQPIDETNNLFDIHHALKIEGEKQFCVGSFTPKAGTLLFVFSSFASRLWLNFVNIQGNFAWLDSLRITIGIEH